MNISDPTTLVLFVGVVIVILVAVSLRKSKLTAAGVLILGISGCVYSITALAMFDCFTRNINNPEVPVDCFRAFQPSFISSLGLGLGFILIIIGIAQSFLKKKSETNIQYGDRINMSGTFHNSIVNVKSQIDDAVQKIETTDTANLQTRAQLKQLLIELGNELQQAPAAKSAEAEAVAQTAKQLIEQATKDKPNKPLLQITSQGLKQAAENIADVLPQVLSISTTIIGIILAR